MKTKTTENEADTIVAVCPHCEGVVFAAVNKPKVLDTEMFKEIGELVAAGRKIEHWNVEKVRQSKFGCKCQ